MASLGMQMLASALCLVGWGGVIISCIMPMWKVTAFVGSTIVTAQTIWEGIWMSCVVESTGLIQCQPYESMLALTSDLQAARAFMVLSITTGIAGLFLAFVGGKCTRFLDEEAPGAKSKVAVAAGGVLILTGLLCLIPTAWIGGVVVRTFYSTAFDAQRRELGASLYIGWGSAILLMLGGGLFINSAFPLKSTDADKAPSVHYLVVRSSNGSQPGSHCRLPSVKSISVLSRAQSYEQPTNRPQIYTRPLWDEDAPAPGSERSWAPSTKSQMKRYGSAISEQSLASTTKSKLKRAKMEDDTELAESENEDMLTNPPRTYI